MENAYNVMDELDQIIDPRPSGKYTYAKARILAQMGNKVQAMAMMKKAIAEGFPNEYAEFRYGEDIDFEPLRGYDEYENFVIQD